MPAVDDPFGMAASMPGQLAELRRQLKDLSVNRTFAPNIFTVGAGGLTVLGPSALNGPVTFGAGVTGPVAATGPVSGTTLSGTSVAVTGAASSATSAVSGNSTVGGDINLTGDLYTPHGKITPVVSGYVAAYINTDGRLGASVSAQRFKQDIAPHTYTLDQIALIQIVSYRLRTAVAKLGNGARVEVGVIAEQLVSAGMPEFVVYGDDGQCLTVAYERLDLVAIAGVQLLYAEIVNIKKRLTAAGL